MGQVAGEEQLDAVFAALADATRRAILARLKQGEATVAELARPFAMTQPAVSKHLRVLEQAGLITRSRRGTARLSHLDAAPLRPAAAWLADYRAYWQESHDRLAALLADMAAAADPAATPPTTPDPGPSTTQTGSTP